MKHRRFIEPCPARRGDWHDWVFDPEAVQVYPGPGKRQVAEYCTYCNRHVNLVEDVPDIEPRRPDHGPYYKGDRPKPAA